MSQFLIPQSHYHDIFINDHPMMDVRAPIEFLKGAFPTASNHPLLNDNERQQVGTCYKALGQQAAIQLGQQLISGTIKQQRIEAWQAYSQRYPHAFFYCFRGGLRSQITQMWLKEIGITLPFIEGGYKAMRQYLLNQLELACSRPMLIVSGSTGCGKTDFLAVRDDSIDLESIANHRGSSFGANLSPQPSQINFENQLAINLLKHQHNNYPVALMEDESHLIGRCAIPRYFYLAMQQAPIIVLETTQAKRIERLANNYVITMHANFIDKYGDEKGFELFADYLFGSCDKIKKRLGGKQHQHIRQLITIALNDHKNRNSLLKYQELIEILLEKYYDPMYEYQLNKKADRVLAIGDKTELNDWLKESSV
ncbi:MAG: tRNA 2-selenouridine(34) synthase MnmH [Parashewanella sp.]